MARALENQNFQILSLLQPLLLILWYTFEILQLDSTYLNKDVSDWESSDEHPAVITSIESLNAINDGAERGVTMSSDFQPASKSEGYYQDLLQVVEQDRHRQSNLRKRKLTSE